MFNPQPKTTTWELEAYREFVSRLPLCFRCHKARLPGERFHPHHERIGGGGGMALKPSDVYLLPLCGGCHNIRHSSAFIGLGHFYTNGREVYGAEDVFDEIIKAGLFSAMLESLNSFLFTVNVRKK